MFQSLPIVALGVCRTVRGKAAGRRWGMAAGAAFAAASASPALATELEPPLEEIVVVTGTRSPRNLGDAPVRTEVITRKEIEASGARSLDQVLEEYPGVFMTRDVLGNASPQVQGMSGKYVLILLNGERLGGRKNGSLDLARLSTLDIERVELVRGPASALYGADALGGVINIITRRGHRRLSLGGRLEAGTLSQRLVEAAARGRRGDISYGAAAGYRSRAAFDLTPANVDTTGPSFRQWTASASGGYHHRGGSELRAHAEYLLRDQHSVSEARGVVEDAFNRTETLTLQVSPSLEFDDGAALRSTVGYTLFRDQLALDARPANAEDTQEDTREHLLTLSNQYQLLAGRAHQVVLGLDGSAEKLTGERIDNAAPERLRFAPYLQDEWELGAGVALVPAVRVDVDSQFGAQSSPKLSVRWDATTRLRLRASYATGFRAPDFRELYLRWRNPGSGYAVDGNPELRPEVSRSVSADAELAVSSSLWLTAALFHNRLTNAIQTALSAETGAEGLSQYAYQNATEARTYGAEVAARVRVGGFRGNAGYALLRTKDLSYPGFAAELVGRPRHRATLGIGYESQGGIGANLRGAWVGRRVFYQADEEAPGPGTRRLSSPYATVDARLAYNVFNDLSVYLLAENLLNAGDPEFLPIAPRTLSAGLSGDLL